MINSILKQSILSSLLCCSYLYAQKAEEMPQVWETKLDHSIDYAFAQFGGISIAASDKEITAINSTTGAKLWNKKFKEIAPKLRKIDEAEPIWDANAVFLFDRKAGKDQVCVIDVATGNPLWTSEKYQNLDDENIIYIKEKETFILCLEKSIVMVNAKTGEEKWQLSGLKGIVGAYVYDGAEDAFLFLNARNASMMEELFVGDAFAGWKNQLMKVKANTGEIVWENKFFGIPQRKVVTREKLFDLDLKGDKVILTLSGIQTYDYASGKQIFTAAFDYTPERVRGVKFNTYGCPTRTAKKGVYGAVAEPVNVGDELYVMDAQKPKEQFIKKYDVKSGQLLWTSEDIKGAKVLPYMGVTNDRVVVQVGGQIETQAKGSCIKNNSDGSTSRITYASVDFNDVKPYGLRGIDTKTGKLAWESEKFKKGITNSFLGDDNNIIICSGVAVYSINPANGNENFEIKLNKSAIGEASRVLNYNNKVIVIGEKGIAAHNEKNGAEIISTKYKKSSLYRMSKDFLIMKTEKEDFAAFDTETCNYKYYDARNGSTALLSDDGKELMVYEKKSVTLLKTK